MRVSKKIDMISLSIAFRNRMNRTNCDLHDIMRIYIGKSVVDLFKTDCRKKRRRRK